MEVPTDVTRWNNTYDMLDCVMEQQPPICAKGWRIQSLGECIEGSEAIQECERANFCRDVTFLNNWRHKMCITIDGSAHTTFPL